MTTGYTIGDSAYRNRREVIAGEIGRWTSEPIVDVEAAVTELLAMKWFDESLGEVEPDEVRDGIAVHNDYLSERGLVADVDSEDYPIEIAEYNSAGIRAEAAAYGATHMREIGRGHSDGDDDNPNSRVIFFELAVRDGLTVRVADTNGDPVWEEDDGATFSRLAEECGVDLDEPDTPPTITAEVTGRGAESTAPDDPTAVDADIYAHGTHVGAVTLKADDRGDLATWGSCPDHWADSALLGWLDGQSDRRDAIDAIVGAVREAATAETSIFAVVDLGDEGTGTIAEVHELTDRERDEMGKEHGRRLVYLPGGGEVGDRVTIDEDGVAEVAGNED